MKAREAEGNNNERNETIQYRGQNIKERIVENSNKREEIVDSHDHLEETV